MLLEGKVAIITGAASERGIGRATAKRFADEGARVVIVDLDALAAEAAAAALGAAHRGFACDVADPDQCHALIAAVLAEYGQIDIVVNAAGVSQSDSLMEITQEKFDLVIDVSLRGSLNMCQAAVPHMRESGGSIVCFGSVAAQRGGGLFGGPHYAAAKGGVHSLTKSLARELGKDRIRVNAVSPGTIDTDIFQGKMSAERKAQIAADIPLGRLGAADDVACVCLFLASDLARFVTGSILDVNGGQFIH
ncbi:SDR family NAD(P)-dependent oxidoreductase [Roseixanthobacter liquoris]|uniref:SDR family NAD(P)-dependent oxidoreductase n=1 Tax=Roseixanthobacter liquoris TaxID=3119921 RepID=UPI003729FD5C